MPLEGPGDRVEDVHEGEELSLEKKSPHEVQDILDRLKAGLERLYEARLRGVYLYGSYGRGDARAGSDIDVLIVLDRMDSSWDEIKRTSELRAGLSLEHDVTLNTLSVAEERWKRDDDVSIPPRNPARRHSGVNERLGDDVLVDRT